MNVLKKLKIWCGFDDESELPPIAQYKRMPYAYQGIIPYTIDKILAHNQHNLDRIRQTVPCTNDHYDQYYLPLIHRYAAYVHLLPASQCHHHREAGGLLAHGLEVAQHSLTLLNSDRFLERLSKGVRDNRDAMAIMSLGCFVAALAHDLPKILDLIISDESENQTYQFFETNLVEWLQKNNVKYYHVRFRPDRHREHVNLIPMTHDSLLPEEIRSYLCSGTVELSEEIFRGIGGFGQSSITSCVLEADKVSVCKYTRTPPFLPSPALNAGMAPHECLTVVVKQMFSDGHWRVNARGSVAKLIDNQLYLVWPQACTEMVPFLPTSSVTVIPRDPDTVAQILMDWGIIDEGVRGTPYWFVDRGGVALKTIRLARANRWLNQVKAPFPSKETEQLQQAPEKLAASHQPAHNNSVVQQFLEMINLPEPPFPVREISQNLYASKADAEKWFGRNGVSKSQMLRFVKDGQLGLIQLPDGAGKLIGPPS